MFVSLDEQGAQPTCALVAQSFQYLMNKKGHGVEFAIHNSAGWETHSIVGDVSVADIAGKLLPFAKKFYWCVYDVKGETIAVMLEGAINNALDNGVVGTGSGSFLILITWDFVITRSTVRHRIHHLEIHSGNIRLAASCSRPNLPRRVVSPHHERQEGYNAVLDMIGDGLLLLTQWLTAFYWVLTRPPWVTSIQRAVLNCMECFR